MHEKQLCTFDNNIFLGGMHRACTAEVSVGVPIASV